MVLIEVLGIIACSKHPEGTFSKIVATLCPKYPPIKMSNHNVQNNFPGNGTPYGNSSRNGFNNNGPNYQNNKGSNNK